MADRGLWSEAHLALLAQASGHAVQRVGACRLVAVTMGRPFGMPSGHWAGWSWPISQTPAQRRGAGRPSGGAPSTESPVSAWRVNPGRPHGVEPRVKKCRATPFPGDSQLDKRYVSSWPNSLAPNVIPFGLEPTFRANSLQTAC